MDYNIDPAMLTDPAFLSFIEEYYAVMYEDMMNGQQPIEKVPLPVKGNKNSTNKKTDDKNKEQIDKDNKDKSDKKDELKEEDEVPQIQFSVYVKQLLNQNNQFIDLKKAFIDGIDMSKLATINNDIESLFKEIADETVEQIFNTEDIQKLVIGEINPTIETVLEVIKDMMNTQLETNQTLLQNFPNMNLDLVKPCYYDKKAYTISCLLNFNEFYKFYFSNFCNHPIVDIRPDEHQSRYMSYNYNINDSKFNFQTTYAPDVGYYDPNYVDTPYMISYQQGIISLDVLNHGYLYRIISAAGQNGNRFAPFQLIYKIHGSRVAHACFIIFDLIYQNVFFLDPNGSTNFLTKYITGKDPNKEYVPNVSLPYVMDLFDNYIKKFNEWNSGVDKVEYKLYKSSTGIVLNTRDTYSYNYDMGHCQTLVLLIMYLLYMHQYDIKEDILTDFSERFNRLSQRELQVVKYAFSANLVKIGKDNGVINRKYFGDLYG